MRIARLHYRRLYVGTLLALALVAAGIALPARAQQADSQRIGLDGYCPVCIIDAKKWEKGSADYQAVYDDITYNFPNKAIKDKFVANPAKYVPALGGDCVVCYAKLGKRVPGTAKYAVRQDNRVFLFPSDKEREVFLKNAKDYVDVDLALKGDCAVCLDHAKKHVPGKAEFTEVYKGFRYLFPSAKEQAEFRKDPARYAAAGSKTSAPQGNNQPVAKDLLTVTGQTTCAGCEHGVTSLQNPEELGLAVNTADGKVVIVERAHELYKDVYSKRFTGQRVRVSGEVLKREGHFIWIDPTELTVVM
jgi:YHS domain-containing protein